MNVSYIYIYRPPISLPSYSYLTDWIDDARSLMHDEPDWEQWHVLIVEMTNNLGINLATEVRRIKENPGPVIFASKVQHNDFQRLSERLSRIAVVYPGQGVTCGISLYQICECARVERLGGEPSITRRELVCYLIVAKLKRMGKWAGEAKNKSFLNSEDLPNGGFPKYVTKREILDAANVLENAGVLESKLGDNNKKYGLGSKAEIESISENRSFAGNRQLEKWFRKDKLRVSAAELTANYQ